MSKSKPAPEVKDAPPIAPVLPPDAVVSPNTDQPFKASDGTEVKPLPPVTLLMNSAETSVPQDSSRKP